MEGAKWARRRPSNLHDVGMNAQEITTSYTATHAPFTHTQTFGLTNVEHSVLARGQRVQTAPLLIQLSSPKDRLMPQWTASLVTGKWSLKIWFVHTQPRTQPRVRPASDIAADPTPAHRRHRLIADNNADEVSMVVIECDGFRWHGNRLQWKLDRARLAAIETRGWRVVTVNWADVVERPDETATRIRIATRSNAA